MSGRASIIMNLKVSVNNHRRVPHGVVGPAPGGARQADGRSAGRHRHARNAGWGCRMATRRRRRPWRTDQAPGQGKIGPGPPQQAGQKIGAADVGEKADAHLRHTEAIALPGHGKRAVKGDADAAPEHEAVDQGGRLG